MSTVGIIVNPNAGKDIRRLVTPATHTSDVTKVGIVRRAIVAAAEAGATRILIAPDSHRLGSRAADGLDAPVKIVDEPVTGSRFDTIGAARRFWKEQAGAVIALGGDGTSRDVALGWPDAPLIAVSTGTNNVYPLAIDGTSAGAAAGLVASGAVDVATVTRRSKRVVVRVDDRDSSIDDVALVDLAFIDAELRRRQAGYGRGARQRLETDSAEVLSGVMHGSTMGGPVTLRVANRDSRLDDAAKTPPVHQPRPGHADLAGSVKWLTTDCRATLERASARETAARVAAGALARCLLREFGIECFGFVRASLDVRCACEVTPDNWKAMRDARDASEVGMPCTTASQQLIDRIHQAKVEKDTVGGLVEAHVFGCPIGLGTCVQWNERLDSRLAAAVMGIQAFKAVEIGLGRECAFRTGSQVHDPIAFDPARRNEPHLGFVRTTNNAGGLEGGMTNGMPVVVTGTMKPKIGRAHV